jgi:hypothetical protein
MQAGLEQTNLEHPVEVELVHGEGDRQAGEPGKTNQLLENTV